MRHHIQEAIDVLGDPITGRVFTPATLELFDEDQVISMVTVECGEKFKSVVMKVQWIAEQGRPDMRLPLSYLTTRLTKAMSQDWRKLRLVLMFLYCTIDDDMVIGIRGFGCTAYIGWCVICHTSGHERTHRRCHVTWARYHPHTIFQAKAKYKEFI